MQFNVAGLLKDAIGIAQRHSLDERDLPLGDLQVHRLWGRVRLTRVNAGVWASANLRATVTCSCSRCLQDYEADLRFRFEETYHPVLDVFSGVRVPLPEDADPDFAIDAHHTLDLSEAVRQSVIVALPMKLLCSADCAGLCPTCGADLNVASCTCSQEVRNPQWGPLLEMFALKNN